MIIGPLWASLALKYVKNLIKKICTKSKQCSIFAKWKKALKKSSLTKKIDPKTLAHISLLFISKFWVFQNPNWIIKERFIFRWYFLQTSKFKAQKTAQKHKEFFKFLKWLHPTVHVTVKLSISSDQVQVRYRELFFL